ncbi:MAG: hypothetical protein Q7T86_16700 [Hyphomicrobiaceae bacterium]|nr:hypothetical protein [Hyphomicrobiaceae bacterium]
MVKVYFYKVSDPKTGEVRVPDRKATITTISRLNGVSIVETEEEVAISMLDNEGRYDPTIGDRADQRLDNVAEKLGAPE